MRMRRRTITRFITLAPLIGTGISAASTAIMLPAPVKVPMDFLGMCWMRYPVAANDYNPVGILKWGAMRASQLHESRWNNIELSPGIYDAAALAKLDRIITFQRRNGAAVMLGVYGTPRHWASTAANPKYSDYNTAGRWNAVLDPAKFGEGAFPTSLGAVTNYVSMLVNRYNLPGGAWYGAHSSTLGKGIQAWETWNEPELPVNGSTNGNSFGFGGRSSNFWWGSKEQMVDMAYTQYAAIKALDPSIIVTCPGLVGNQLQRASRFFPITGTATGKTGAQACDAYAWHPYGCIGKNYSPWGTWAHNVVDHPTDGITAIRTMLAGWGLSLPLYITEWGMAEDVDSAQIAAFYAQPAAFRRSFMESFLLTCAAFGVKQVHPWHWQQPSLLKGNSGAWPTDTAGVAAAYNAIAANVVGKTIVGLKVEANGPLTVTFSDGSTYTTAA